MKYINAKDILPEELVRELQRYAEGGYLYIPVEEAHQKRWGEVSGYRQELERRNRRIEEEYRQGIRPERLAEKYCLSVHAIRKILYRKKRDGGQESC